MVRLNRLDLNLLIALDALLDEKSITRAAERIHLSQPATSGALARLREFFGDELLVRVGSKMQPTPLGESLAAPVHNILLQIQATVERGIEFQPEDCDRRFKVIVGDYFASTYMVGFLKRMSELAPKMQFEFFQPSTKPVAELENGGVDFVVIPEHILSAEHPHESLISEDFVCIASSDNDAVYDGMTVAEFMALGHVVVRFGAHRQKSQDQILLESEYGLEPRVEVIASTFNSIPLYIPGTRRIAIVYRHLGESWSRTLPIKLVKPPMKLPVVTWGVQWHQFRNLDPAIQWLRKQMISFAKDYK